MIKYEVARELVLALEELIYCVVNIGIVGDYRINQSRVRLALAIQEATSIQNG